LIRRFIEDYHERQEEEMVFPRFEARAQAGRAGARPAGAAPGGAEGHGDACGSWRRRPR
jgi:hypothetical protein